MTLRKYEIELSGTVILEFDDELKTPPDLDADGRQWTLLDAHLDARRFRQPIGWPESVLQSLAVILGVENRTLYTDGWADFPTYDDLTKAGIENPYDVLPRGHMDGYWALEDWREVDSEGYTVRRDEAGEVIPRG